MTTISSKILLLEDVHLDLYRPPRGLLKLPLNPVPNSTLVLQSRNYAIIYSLFDRLQGEEVKEAGKVEKVGKTGKIGKVNNI